MNKADGDFVSLMGWVVITRRNPKTGKRYAFDNLVRRTRSEAIRAYLRADNSLTWRQWRDMYGCEVVQCHISPMEIE